MPGAPWAVLTAEQVDALATAAVSIRPDWQHEDVVSALGKSRYHFGPVVVASALFRLAASAQSAVSRLPTDGPWWPRPLGPRYPRRPTLPDHEREAAHRGYLEAKRAMNDAIAARPPVDV